ncbi:MAG: putative glycosyltransferase [bacterium P3]|nr:MAG: putative glycosyltransferase [bacterium P3]KWW40676.1 MAG: putative glycosyltransferase [bacterium F083]
MDNNSDDGSVSMVREKYPEVHLVANKVNRGFSQANNQALRAILEKEDGQPATGHYVLILNPDTLVETDTLRRCLNYMRHHPECGGLGVKMVNADGIYLRESKRGFPSPLTSFYKICGLASMFPQHPRYAAYYMGHLDPDEVNEVDILPGAFLLTSVEVLRHVGLFDESYFMYAEDVDFSWRIHKAGYRNIYFPEARILHYKGECTRRETLSYVYTFYHAMAIFTRHYFGDGRHRAVSLLLHVGIWMRALAGWLHRIALRLTLPTADMLLSFAGFAVIKKLWATYWLCDANYYPALYTWAVLPLYSLILLTSVYLSGGYDKPPRPLKIAQGVGLGALALLAFYSLLDESMRYSRAIVLMGSIWTLVSTLMLRGVLSALHVDGYNRRSQRHRRYLIVGSEEQQQRVFNLLGTLGIVPRSVITTPHRLGDVTQHVDEVVFCARDIPLSDILDDTMAWRKRRTNFRIVPATDDVLLGSKYTECPEQLYVDDFARITSAASRRNKRLFDLTASLLLITLSPALFWLQKHKKNYFAHCFQVFAGCKSWVGYSNCDADTPLPHIKAGVLRTCDRMPHVKNPDMALLDRQYSQHYRVATDFTILMINILKL